MASEVLVTVRDEGTGLAVSLSGDQELTRTVRAKGYGEGWCQEGETNTMQDEEVSWANPGNRHLSQQGHMR